MINGFAFAVLAVYVLAFLQKLIFQLWASYPGHTLKTKQLWSALPGRQCVYGIEQQ